jgi:hypothetical protein
MGLFQTLLIFLLGLTLCNVVSDSPPHVQPSGGLTELANLVAGLRNAILARNVQAVKEALVEIEDFGEKFSCPICPSKKSKLATTPKEPKGMVTLYNKCTADLLHAREVLESSKIHQAKEVEKLKSVQNGVALLMKELRMVQQQSSEKDQELSFVHQQEAAAQIERDILEIQEHARVNYETGEIEMDQVSSKEFEELLSSRHVTRALPVDAAMIHTDPKLLLDFVILLGAAALGGALAQMATNTVPLPHIVGFLLAGAVVGPGGIGLVGAVIEVDTVAQFGGVFFMFGHGLDFSLKVCRFLDTISAVNPPPVWQF